MALPENHGISKRKVAAILAIMELTNEGDGAAKRGKTREWVRRREEKGLCNNIVRELSIEDTTAYKEMMRMSHEDFLRILGHIEPDITPHQVTGGNNVISPKSRLTLAIRFLATGETFRSLSFQFRMSPAAISYIIKDVCLAVIKNMEHLYLNVPSNAEDWLKIAREFDEKWQFPNCIGAIDGKHVVIQPPAGAGSQYYNYKHTHSIVLLAVAGPNYECIYADIGTNGRVSDGGVWNKCSLSKAIENGENSLPPPSCLPFSAEKMPYVFVADDAFALKSYLMKPYPQTGLDEGRRIYNYRHSRARRISENLFGIIANRWRLFRTPISLQPENVEGLMMATLIIHNFLRKSESQNIYCPVGFTDTKRKDGMVIPGNWRKNLPTESFLSLNVSLSGHNATMNAKQIRESFKDYFCNEGAVEWQWDMC